jgi:serine/threonine protein kinase
MGIDELIEAMKRHDEANRRKKLAKAKAAEPKRHQVIEDYEIGDDCGKGGTSKVKYALHLRTEDERVIKYPRPDKVLEFDMKDIFTREAKFLSELDHPNIVKGYKPFNYCGTICIPLECLDTKIDSLFYQGSTHKDFLQKLYLFMSQSAGALEYLHDEKGILHCDIKPSQFRIRDGVVKLTDFGSARRIGEKRKYVVSTPQYYPKRNKQVDISTDIHAYGKTVAAVIMKAAGINGDDALQILTDDQALVDTLRKEQIPLYIIENIICNCLTASERNYTAKDLKADIKAVGIVHGFNKQVVVKDLYTGKTRAIYGPAILNPNNNLYKPVLVPA